MKKMQGLPIFILGLLAITALPSFADLRHVQTTTPAKGEAQAGRQDPAPGSNPIILDGQIRAITRDGDAYLFWLIRQKVPVVAWPTTYVREGTGPRLYIAELVVQDVIHVVGNLDRDSIRADRIVRQLHIEHRP
jgi:hypothetical protein